MIPIKLSVSKMNDNTSFGRKWNNPSIEGETWLPRRWAPLQSQGKVPWGQGWVELWKLFWSRAHGRAANDNQSSVFLKIATHHDHGLNLDWKKIIIGGMPMYGRYVPSPHLLLWCTDTVTIWGLTREVGKHWVPEEFFWFKLRESASWVKSSARGRKKASMSSSVGWKSGCVLKQPVEKILSPNKVTQRRWYNPEVVSSILTQVRNPPISFYWNWCVEHPYRRLRIRMHSQTTYRPILKYARRTPQSKVHALVLIVRQTKIKYQQNVPLMKIPLAVAKFLCFPGYSKAAIVTFTGFLTLWSMTDIVSSTPRWKTFGAVIKIWAELKEWRRSVIWLNICHGPLRSETIIAMR